MDFGGFDDADPGGLLSGELDLDGLAAELGVDADEAGDPFEVSKGEDEFSDGTAVADSGREVVAKQVGIEDSGSKGGDSNPPVESGDGAIVQYEDKKLYPSQSEIYGEGVSVQVEDEDAQAVEEPLVAPISSSKLSMAEADIPKTVYEMDFCTALMSTPGSVRNVAVLGHLHHGKTSLCDSIIEQSHARSWALGRSQVRYTDARRAEQERGVSMHLTAYSLVVRSLEDRSLLLHLVDCPGHPDFEADVEAAVRACDCALLAVDCVEGVRLGTRRAIQHAVRAGCRLVLAVTKIDRLILETHVPPEDAYAQLLAVVSDVNAAIAAVQAPGSTAPPQRVDPRDGSVVFSAAPHALLFSLESFLAQHARVRGVQQHEARRRKAGAAAASAVPPGVSPARLARRMWGDWRYNFRTRTFVSVRAARARAAAAAESEAVARGLSRAEAQLEGERAAVADEAAAAGGGGSAAQSPFACAFFVLEPLWKLYSEVLTAEAERLQTVLGQLRVRLPASAYRHSNPKVLLKLVMAQWCGSSACLGSALGVHCPPPAQPSGGGAGATPEQVLVEVVKAVPDESSDGFRYLVSVREGSLAQGGRLVVHRAGGHQTEAEVAEISLSHARFVTNVSRAPPGNLVLLRLAGDVILETGEALSGISSGTTGSAESPSLAEPTTNMPSANAAVVKVAVEPVKPSELPKLVAGLRRMQAAFASSVTKVEENGEYSILGRGELHIDAMLEELRGSFAGIEIRVTDPSTPFRESLAQASAARAKATSLNSMNSIFAIGSPLDAGVQGACEAGLVGPSYGQSASSQATRELLRRSFGWDALAAVSVVGCGPSDKGPNVIVDDTLPGTSGSELLKGSYDAILSGFRWGCQQGPLCEEPLRGVQLRIVSANLDEDARKRSPGQLIPAVRKAAFAAVLLGDPVLMEPVHAVEIIGSASAVEVAKSIVTKRRGRIVAESPIQGSALFCIHAYIPVIDSFGFETDVRSATSGQAFAVSTFDHWQRVPGDPLDETVTLRPLEPSAVHELAREFVVKTRRRKGLSEDVAVKSYLEQDVLAELAASTDD